jgi:hypothetical protein
MVMLAIVSILFGALLGLRFKVPVLLPAIALAWPVVAVDGVVLGYGAWELTLAMIVASTSVQLGYIGGGLLRSVVASHRPDVEVEPELPHEPQEDVLLLYTSPETQPSETPADVDGGDRTSVRTKAAAAG